MTIKCSVSNNEILEYEQAVVLFIAKRKSNFEDSYIHHDKLADYVPISPPFLVKCEEYGDYRPIEDSASKIQNELCLRLFEVACKNDNNTITDDAQKSLDAMMEKLNTLSTEEKIKELTYSGFKESKDISVMTIHHEIYSALIGKVYKLKASELFFKASNKHKMKATIENQVMKATKHLNKLSKEKEETIDDERYMSIPIESDFDSFLKNNHISIQTILFEHNLFDVKKSYNIEFYKTIANLIDKHEEITGFVADFFAFKYALFRLGIKYQNAVYGSQFGNANFVMTVAKSFIEIIQNRIIDEVLDESGYDDYYEMLGRFNLADYMLKTTDELKTLSRDVLIHKIKQLSLDDLEDISKKMEE